VEVVVDAFDTGPSIFVFLVIVLLEALETADGVSADQVCLSLISSYSCHF
jgi:hypothetical protein